MKYAVLYVDHTFATRNKLEEHIIKELMRINHTVVIAEDLEWCKKLILAKIDQINKAHPRCKPIQCHWYQFRDEKAVSLTGLRHNVKFILGEEVPGSFYSSDEVLEGQEYAS